MLQLTDRNFILSQEGFFVPLKTHTYKVTEPPVEPGVFEIQKIAGEVAASLRRVRKNVKLQKLKKGVYSKEQWLDK